MVSLGRASGYFDTDTSHDHDMLVDNAVISCEEEQVRFRAIPIVWAISTELFLLVLFEVLVFTLPTCYNCIQTPPSAISLLIYCHFVLWCILLILGRYLHSQQDRYRRYGYLDFYLQTSHLRQAPAYIFSAGNAILLLVIVLMEDYCKERFPLCPSHINLEPFHYVQIISTLEVLLVLPILSCFLIRTIQFNKRQPNPDVEQEEQAANFLYGQVPYTDIGFRDEDRLDDVLEKQADLIRYLKQHNARLGKKIAQMSNEMRTIRMRSLPIA